MNIIVSHTTEKRYSFIPEQAHEHNHADKITSIQFVKAQ